MSGFFGGNQSPGPSVLNVAKIEAEVMTEMFHKMGDTCFRKCVVRHTDGELAVGEMTCIDRCVGKYLMAQERVGDTLKAFEATLQAQAATQPGTLPRKP